MQANAPSSSAAPFPQDYDVDGLSIALQHPPEHGSAAVTDNSTLPVGENGSHPPAMWGESTMSNCIHPAINPVQVSPLHPRCDRVPSQARGNELSERDDTVLLFGDTDDPKLGCGAFFPHVGEQVATPASSPPEGTATRPVPWRAARI